MKKLLLVRCFLLAIIICLSLEVYAMSTKTVIGNSSKLLCFGGIKKSYPAHALIEIELHNNTDKALFYYCAVEKKIDGDWREVVPSIKASKISKAVELSKIGPNQSQKLIWNRNQQQFYLAATKPGVFRFKIEILEEQEKKPIGRIFSEEFEILE